MSNHTALFGANVLFSALLRDALIQIALTDVFEARWTEDIHREWMDALMRNRPQLDRVRLEYTRERMDTQVNNCLITGYADCIPSLNLPDPKDNHVLAAAITGHCDIIVTFNLRDFPAKALAPHGIEALHPDEFVLRLIDIDRITVCFALALVRARLKKPSMTVQEFLETLKNQGLSKSVAELTKDSRLL